MPIRRPRGPKPALLHVEFLEAMESLPEVDSARRPLESAFLTLRLLDAWVALGSEIAEPAGQALNAVRDSVDRAGSDPETQASLRGVIDAIVMLHEPDAQPLLPRVFAFGGLLERRGALKLAADVYGTVSRYVDSRAHFDLAFDALMRRAFCLRVEGVLDEAARSYGSAGALAARARDRSRVLYARIGDAKVVWARGNLPEADTALGKIAAEAEAIADARLHAVALHDLAGVSRAREDLPRAVRLAFESFCGQTDELEKERVLMDLSTFLSLTGAFETARTALTLLATGARLSETRWYAQVNLMDLAAREGSETRFEQMRRALNPEPLPTRLRAVYLKDAGSGLASFGRVAEAREALLASRAMAVELGLHQLDFAVSTMLEDLERERIPAVRNRPTPKPAPDDIAETIAELLREAVSAS